MARSLILLVMLLNALTGHAAETLIFKTDADAPQVCKELARDLNQTVRLESYSVPDTISSGTPLGMEFVLSKTEHLSEEVWIRNHSTIVLNSIINLPYTKLIHHEPNPSLKDFFFEPGSSQRFVINTVPAANIGGIATHELSFLLIQPGNYWCIVSASVNKKTAIISTNLDITPPLVKNITFDRNSYRPGERVVATFTFSEPLKKAESDHIEFKNRNPAEGEQNPWIPEYDSSIVHKLRRISSTVYEFVFNIPLNQSPGSYHPDYFNRSDMVNNFEDRIGKEDPFEKRIADTSPLVIVDSGDSQFSRVDEDIKEYKGTKKDKELQE